MTTAEEVQKAKEIFCDMAKNSDGWMGGCTSYLQRKLGCGYNHATNIIAHLVAHGFISEPNSVGKRRLIQNESPVGGKVGES